MNHDSQTIKVFLGKDLALTRQYNCIAKYEKDKNEKKTAENAAIKIQSVQRGRKGRREAAEIKKKWEEGLEQKKEGKAELIKHSFEVKKNLLIDLLKKYESNKETSGITLNNIDDDAGLNKIVNDLILMDPRNYKYDFLRKIHKEYIENLKKSKDEEEDEDDEEESEEEDEEEESEEEKKFNEGESQEKREKELEHTVDNNCYCQVKPSLDKASNYKSHEEFCKDLNKTSECSRQPNCIPLIGKLILYYKEIDPYKAEKSVATYNKQINFLKNNMSKIVDKIDFQQSWETDLLKEIKKFVEAIKLWETETYITRVYDGKELHYKVINKNCPEVEIDKAEKEECFVKYILFKYRGEKFVKTITQKYNLSRLKGAIRQGVQYTKANDSIKKEIEELLLKKSEKEPVVIATEIDNNKLKKLEKQLEETKKNLREKIAESEEHAKSNNEKIKKLKEQQQQELQKKLDEQSEKYEKELQERAKEAETEKGELEQKKKEYEQKAKEAEKNATKSEQKIERLNKQIKNLSEEDVKKKAQLEAEKKKLEEEQAVVEERKKKSEEEQAVVEQRKKELHKEQIEIERLKSQHEQELKELKEERKKAEDREEEKRKQAKEEFMERKGELIESELKKLKETDSIGDIKIEGIKKSYPTLHKKIKNFLVFKENELIKAHHAKFYSDNINRNNEKLVETLKLVPGEPFLGIEGLPLVSGFGSNPEQEEVINLKEIKEGVRQFIMSKAEYIFIPSQHEQLSVKEYLKTL